MGKTARSISIIGGAEGPTSVWIVGKGRHQDKNPFRRMSNFLRSKRYTRSRRRAEKRIRAGAHTLEETLLYIEEKYGAVQAGSAYPHYEERREQLRCTLLQKEKPELAGTLVPIPPPADFEDKDAVREWMRRVDEQAEECLRKAAAVPEEDFPFDYALYLIDQGEAGRIEIETESIRQILSISYAGSKRVLAPVTREIYLYFGVTKEDIQRRSERYTSLVTELAT